MTRTLIIDRRFRGVGRICLVSGTTNPVVKGKYERMLVALYDDGKVDILRAIRDRVLTFADAHDAYRRRAMHELATGDTAQELQKAWAAWVKGADASEKHRISLGMSGKYLKRADGKARVGDLPRLLRKLRETLGAEHPRSFNLLRAAVSAFVRDTLSRAHPLYASCTAVPTRTVKRKRKGRPLSVEQLQNYFGFPAAEPVGEIAWWMATTGMGAQEFWGEWSVNRDASCIHIEGTKREGRVRDVPLVLLPARPAVHRQTFEKKFRDRTMRAFQPYDLRRTYANLLELAGIPRTRRRLYMGHGASSVTDLYEHHEVRRFLIEDADRLAKILPQASVKAHVIPLRKQRGA